MENHTCDECGKKLEEITILANIANIEILIGYTGTVVKHIAIEDEYSNDRKKPIQDGRSIDFEMCSKKCLLSYLRKELR